jgi:hypothetical protein
MLCCLTLVVIMFQRRLLLYSNIETQLKAHGVENVVREDPAGNVTHVITQNGGLFLTETSIVFIPHRFTLKPAIISLPLRRLKEERSRINPLRIVSTGLARHLSIDTIEGERYAFHVREVDQWIESIRMQSSRVLGGGS